jgi:hypothetical protein
MVAGGGNHGASVIRFRSPGCAYALALGVIFWDDPDAFAELQAQA